MAIDLQIKSCFCRTRFVARDSTPPPLVRHPKTSTQQQSVNPSVRSQKTGKLPTTTHAPAAAGSGRSEHWKRSPSPLARSAKAHTLASFPASAGPIPRSPHPRPSPIARPATQPPPKNLHPATKRKPKRPIPKDRQIATHHARTGGSGIGPERALEAITLTPRAQRESPYSRELPCERRTDPAEPHPRPSHHRQTRNAPHTAHPTHRLGDLL